MSYRFQGQHSNEDVVLFSRQHPLILLRPFLASATIFLVPMLAFVVITSNAILSYLFILCLIAGLFMGWAAWHAWYNSILLLTTERVVFLSQRSMVNREFVECNLQAVLQVSHEVKGLFSTMFGFGTIAIRTPGTGEPFSIPNMPDPYGLQQEILRVAAGEA
jgi:hypothetical protein